MRAFRPAYRPDQIFHVAVMPCYDKKLEASRPDFATSHPAPSTSTSTSASSEPVSVRDVDLVLTTGEVAKMIDDEGVSLRALASGPSVGGECDGRDEEAFFPFSDLLSPPRGTSSGSYVATALSALLSQQADSSSPSTSSSPSSSALGAPAPGPSQPRPTPITSADLPYLRLDSKLVRSEDYIEYSLVRLSTPYSPSPSSSSSSSSLSTTAPAAADPAPRPERGTVVARAAKCYGFRNLQNVVRKLSRDAGVSLARGAAGRAPPPAARRRGAAAAGTGGGGAAGAEPDVEFIEVMACPGGCVNGGGQVPPPRNSARARRAGESVLVGRARALDDEGMPDVQADVVEAELKLVADPAAASSAGAGLGEAQDRVLSGKEWVAEVERRYWSGASGGEEEEEDGGALAHLHPSIRPYVALLPSASEADALRRVVDELLGGGGAAGGEGPSGSESESAAQRDERRRELLRTSYRAVQSEEVNGLAVVW